MASPIFLESADTCTPKRTYFYILFHSFLVIFVCVEMLLCMAALVFIYLKIYFTCSRSFANFQRTNRNNASPQGQDIRQSERKQHLRNLKGHSTQNGSGG